MTLVYERGLYYLWKEEPKESEVNESFKLKQYAHSQPCGVELYERLKDFKEFDRCQENKGKSQEEEKEPPNHGQQDQEVLSNLTSVSWSTLVQKHTPKQEQKVLTSFQKHRSDSTHHWCQTTIDAHAGRFA